MSEEENVNPRVPIISEHITKQIEDAMENHPGFPERVTEWHNALEKMTPRERAELMALKETQAHNDQLTGILSHAGFVSHAEEALLIEGSIEEGEYPENPNIILYGDIDGLKRTNDTKEYGRKTGNKLLIEIAKALSVNAEDTQIVGKVGSDEFAVMFLKTPLDRILQAHENIQQSVVELREGGEIPEWSGISFSLVEQPPGVDVEEWLLEADILMKAAKDEITQSPGERAEHVKKIYFQDRDGNISEY